MARVSQMRMEQSQEPEISKFGNSWFQTRPRTRSVWPFRIPKLTSGPSHLSARSASALPGDGDGGWGLEVRVKGLGLEVGVDRFGIGRS